MLPLIQRNVAHVGGFCSGQTGLTKESNHCLHLYCCPNPATESDVDKGKNPKMLMKGTPMMRISCMSYRILSLAKTEYLLSETE